MTITGEIADALVSALESPAAQTALVSAITAGEVPLETIAKNFIDGLKATGMIGVVLNAAKGSIDAEIVRLFATLTPTVIAAYLTKLAVDEAKALGG